LLASALNKQGSGVWERNCDIILNMNQELQEYIKKSKEAGKSDEEIKRDLLVAGWKETDINTVFLQEPLSKLEEQIHKQGLKKKILLTLGGFFIIISVYIFVILLTLSNKNSIVALVAFIFPLLIILLGVILFVRGLKIHPNYKMITERKMALNEPHYKFQKPEIVSIRDYLNSFASVKFALTQPSFWLIFAGMALAVFLGLIFLGYGVFSDFSVNVLLIGALLILYPPLYYFSQLKGNINIKFWKGIADANEWQYIPHGNAQQEQGTMFFRKSMTHNISNIIKGSVDNTPFRIFNYKNKISWLVNDPMRGIRPVVNFYTIFAINLNKPIPHIYLNNRHDDLILQNFPKDALKSIPLPTEFEKDFALLLMSPAQYENEAGLSKIFTTEVLNFLLNSTFRNDDIEFVNQEMLIYARGQINDFQDFEKKFSTALELKDLLEEKLKMM